MEETTWTVFVHMKDLGTLTTTWIFANTIMCLLKKNTYPIFDYMKGGEVEITGSRGLQ